LAIESATPIRIGEGFLGFARWSQRPDTACAGRRWAAIPFGSWLTRKRRSRWPLDAEIVARPRDVVRDADLPDAAVIERALNAYLLGRLLDATQATSDLAAEQADQLAVDEVRAYRRERGLVE